MNAAAQPLLRLERVALVAGLAAAVATALLGWMAPGSVASAYRFAMFAALAPAVGSLLFVLIHRMTGGQWAPDLLPYLRAGFTLLPWIWVFTLPLLAFPQHGLAHLATRPKPPDWYAADPMRIARAVAYAIGFFLLAAGARRALRAGREGRHAEWRWFGPAGLIAGVLMLHLLADDWLMELDPGWHSTAFPIVWVTGQALAGLALAILLAVAAGADPRRRGPAERPFGIDWGNLLLAAMVFWCYVTFAQFLIIWAGNLPEEVSWYLRRVRGGWLEVVIALAILDFGLPFLCLLSRRLKTRPGGLAAVAGLLLGCQTLYMAWVVLPAFSPEPPVALATAVAFLAAVAGLFLNRYLALARRTREIAT